MSIEDWSERWRSLEAACRGHRASDRWAAGRAKAVRCSFAPPAREADIAAVEAALGMALPASLRKVVSKHAASMDIAWQLRDEEALPREFDGIFAGEIRWDLATLPALVETHRGWLTECFSDPGNRYDAVWHQKLPVLSVGNGDMIGIELGPGQAGAVVYLSHDDGEGHGYLLGRDFEDYVERLGRLGGVGAEDWQWLRFTSSRTSGLEPDSALAARWRAWLGLGAA